MAGRPSDTADQGLCQLNGGQILNNLHVSNILFIFHSNRGAREVCTQEQPTGGISGLQRFGLLHSG
jgi:hypothetical protein